MLAVEMQVANYATCFLLCDNSQPDICLNTPLFSKIRLINCMQWALATSFVTVGISSFLYDKSILATPIAGPWGDPSRIRFVAKGFKSMREKLGITAKDMSVLLDISAPTIYNWEAGISKPKQPQLIRIAHLRTMTKNEVADVLGQLTAPATKKQETGKATPTAAVKPAPKVVKVPVKPVSKTPVKTATTPAKKISKAAVKPVPQPAPKVKIPKTIIKPAEPVKAARKPRQPAPNPELVVVPIPEPINIPAPAPTPAPVSDSQAEV
jgi:DNA-binding XRE family transcriptional regulator